MYLFISLIPATLVVIIGYFVLFSSTKAQGAVQKFGQILAIWIFVIAAFFPLAGLYATVTDFSLSKVMEKEHKKMHPESIPHEPIPQMERNK